MPTLPNMSLVTPTPGADSGTWDEKINAAFALVDAHDHTSGKGVAIVTAAIDINADLTMAGYGLTNLSKISFSTIALPSSGSKNLFVSSVNNELYWRTNSGTNVQLTSGTSLNASLIGGIAGDYASVGAEVAYDDANDRYTFKQPTTWARLASGEVRVFETGTSESLYVGLAAPDALAGSFTITLPLAAPAAQAMVQMSTAGVLSTASTKTAAMMIPASMFRENGVAAHALASGIYTLGNSTNALEAGVPFEAGDIITEVTLHVNKASDATNTLRLAVVRYNTNGTVTSLGTTDLSSNAPGVTTIVVTGLSVTTTTGVSYGISILQTDASPSAADKIFSADVTFTKALV